MNCGTLRSQLLVSYKETSKSDFTMSTPLPPQGLRGDDAPSEDVPSDSDSATSDPLDLADDEGWEDVAPEEEESQPIVSLFSQEIFPDVRSMIKDCKEKFQFDFVAVQRELGV